MSENEDENIRNEGRSRSIYGWLAACWFRGVLVPSFQSRTSLVLLVELGGYYLSLSIRRPSQAAKARPPQNRMEGQKVKSRSSRRFQRVSSITTELRVFPKTY